MTPPSKYCERDIANAQGTSTYTCLRACPHTRAGFRVNLHEGMQGGQCECLPENPDGRPRPGVHSVRSFFVHCSWIIGYVTRELVYVAIYGSAGRARKLCKQPVLCILELCVSTNGLFAQNSCQRQTVKITSHLVFWSLILQTTMHTPRRKTWLSLIYIFCQKNGVRRYFSLTALQHEKGLLDKAPQHTPNFP